MSDQLRTNELDCHDFLASILDPEERARWRRECGLLEEDDDGRIGFSPSPGSGPQASLNQAILGHSLAEYLHQTLLDRDVAATALRAVQSDRAEKTRAAPYMSRDEVQGVYDAAACLGQVYGLACNAFITIAYQALGLDDPEAEAKLLTAFLDEAAGQMRRWGHPFHAIYVHENSDDRGRHTHVLATIDPQVKTEFAIWAREGAKSFFWRHCKVATPKAVDIVVKGPLTATTKALWQYDRVMYMTKGLDPSVMDRDMQTGQLTPLFTLLGLKTQWQERPAGVIPYRNRIGTTHSIGARARRRLLKDGMPVLSPFADRAWRFLRLDSAGFGWEFSEHLVRQAEAEYRGQQLQINQSDEDFRSALREVTLNKGNVSDADFTDVVRQVRAGRRAALTMRHPYEWQRPWTGWWYQEGRGLRRWGGKSAKEGLARINLHKTSVGLLDGLRSD